MNINFKNVDLKLLLSLKIPHLDRSFGIELSIKLVFKINETKLMNYGKVISIIDNYLFENISKPVLFEMTDIKIFDFDSISQNQFLVELD